MTERKQFDLYAVGGYGHGKIGFGSRIGMRYVDVETFEFVLAKIRSVKPVAQVAARAHT